MYPNKKTAMNEFITVLGARSGTRTRTYIVHMSLKHACLPISAPGRMQLQLQNSISNLTNAPFEIEVEVEVEVEVIFFYRLDVCRPAFYHLVFLHLYHLYHLYLLSVVAFLQDAASKLFLINDIYQYEGQYQLT